MNRAPLLMLMWFSVIAASPALAADPAPQAKASIATTGDIWVGQRGVLVVELFTPGYFDSAPAFELPQVPGVILFPPQDRPVIGSEEMNGTKFTTQRHELTAYAERPGTVKIPPFQVRFDAALVAGKPAKPQQVTTPAVEFTAKLPPGAQGLATIITTTDLTLKETWQPQPDGKPVQVGAAFTRTITIEAHDVPGMVFPSLPLDSPDGLRAYRKPPAIEDHTDRGELTGRRSETVTYECEQAGTFKLPALVLSWWNPEAKELKREELAAQTILVAAPPAPPATAADPAEKPRHETKMVGRVLIALVAILLLWPRIADLRTAWKRRREAEHETEVAYFHEFAKACDTGDARTITQSLSTWVNHFLVTEPAPSIQVFAARSGDSRLTAELAALECAVYGPPAAGKPAWSASQLLKQVRVARARLRHSAQLRQIDHDALPPLNPASIA